MVENIANDRVNESETDDVSSIELGPDEYIAALWPALRAKSISQFIESDAGAQFVELQEIDDINEIKQGMAEKLDEVLAEILKGKTMAQLQGLDTSHLEAIYSVAEARLGAGETKDAASIFQLLILLDPTVAKFYTAFGACQQILKNYEYALEMYAIAQVQDMTDPRVPQNAAMCCLYLNRMDEAKGMANRAISICNTALLSYGTASQVGIDEPAELRRLKLKSEQVLKLIEIRLRNAQKVEA